jgi:hypothetical protein
MRATGGRELSGIFFNILRFKKFSVKAGKSRLTSDSSKHTYISVIKGSIAIYRFAYLSNP